MSIKVERTHDCTATAVTGNRAEIAVFWTIWAEVVWIGWMRDKNHHALASHREAIRQIRDKGKLMLSDTTRFCGDAIVYAIDRCKELGIEIE